MSSETYKPLSDDELSSVAAVSVAIRFGKQSVNRMHLQCRRANALCAEARTMWAMDSTGLGGKLDKAAQLERVRKALMDYLGESEGGDE